MNWSAKQLLRLCLCVSLNTASSLSQATPESVVDTFQVPGAESGSVQQEGYFVGQTSLLTFSADFMSYMDNTKAVLTGSDGTSTTSIVDSSRFYELVTASSPVVQISMDVGNGAIYGFSIAGSLQISAPDSYVFASGGSFTVSDLFVDLTSQQVIGTVYGSHGIEPPTRMAIWTADLMESTITACPQASGCPDTGRIKYEVLVTLSGLHFTSEAQHSFEIAMGLRPLGKGILKASVAELGSWSMSARLDVPSSYGPIAVVPEVSTMYTFGLGLLGLLVVSRKAKDHSQRRPWAPPHPQTWVPAAFHA